MCESKFRVCSRLTKRRHTTFGPFGRCLGIGKSTDEESKGRGYMRCIRAMEIIFEKLMNVIGTVTWNFKLIKRCILISCKDGIFIKL